MINSEEWLDDDMRDHWENNVLCTGYEHQGVRREKAIGRLVDSGNLNPTDEQIDDEAAVIIEEMWQAWKFKKKETGFYNRSGV
jgi:hypothetical protein